MTEDEAAMAVADLLNNRLMPTLSALGSIAVGAYLTDRGDEGLEVAKALQAGTASLRYTITTDPVAYKVDLLSDVIKSRTLLVGELHPLQPDHSPLPLGLH